MAMTKKERAEFDELVKRLRVAAAFHRTQPVPHDLPTPANGSGEMTKGWVFNAYNGTVYRAWSTCISHGLGWERTSASQRGCPLFSTFELARAALRYEVENQAAQKLAAVDALQEPTHDPQ